MSMTGRTTYVPPCEWEHTEEPGDYAGDCEACHEHTSDCGWQWGVSCQHPICTSPLEA